MKEIIGRGLWLSLTLEHPGDDEEHRAGGEPARRRGHGEPHDPDQVDLPAAEPVAQWAADEQERSQRQRVTANYPLQGGHAGVKVAPDGRQGDANSGRD